MVPSCNLLFVCLVFFGCASRPSDGTPSVRQQSFFGVPLPSDQPALFLPGVVSLPDRHEFGSVFTNDGQTLFFAVERGDFSEILTVSRTGSFTEAKNVIGSADFSANDPFLSPTENRLYFITKRNEDYDIGYVERVGRDSWSEPRFETSPINSPKNEFYISFTRDGQLVFASDRAAKSRGDFDIYMAPMGGSDPQKLWRFPPSINTRGYEADAFVDPDSQYLIFSSNRRGGRGRGDLYVSFNLGEGRWSPAVPIDSANSAGHELCPFVSADRRVLFYTSDGDIYWVSAEIIEKLRPALERR